MSHPFFGSDDPTHPFFDDETEDLRLGTARGREAVEQENIASNIAKLQELMKAATNPKRKAHLQKLITNLENQRTGWTRPRDSGRGKKAPYRGFGPASIVSKVAEKHGENAIRGVATGVATAAPLAADLALVIPDLAGSDKAAQTRRKLQENVAVTRETLDPEGGAGFIGELGGGIVAGAPVYGPVANVSGRVLSKAPLIGKAIKPLMTGAGATSTAGKIAASSVGNALAGLPLNVLQAMGIEGTIQDKARVLGMGVGADLLFGGVSRQPVFRERPTVNTDAGPAPREVPPPPPAAGAEPPKATGPDADIEGLNAKAARDRQRAEVRAQWEKNNPDQSWSELSGPEKAAIYRSTLSPSKSKSKKATPTIPEASAEQLAIAKAELARAQAAAAAGDPDAAKLANALESIISRAEPKPVKAPAPKPAATPRAGDRRGGVENRATFQEAQAREAGVGATNPVVRDFVLKKELEKKFNEAGIPFDKSKSVVDLQVELDTHMEGKRPALSTEELQSVLESLKTRGNNGPIAMQAIADIEAQIAARQGAAPEIPVSAAEDLQRIFVRLQNEIIPPAELQALVTKHAEAIKLAADIKERLGGLPNVPPAIQPVIQAAEALVMAARAKPPTASGVARRPTSGRSAIVGQPGATNGGSGGVSPAPIDPIQAKLEALKRGESITPKARSTQVEDFDDIVNRVVDSVPPRHVFDGVAEATARYKAFQDVKGFTAATAADAGLSPEVFDRVRKLEADVLQDIKEFGHHVTGNPSDVPSRSGAQSIEFRTKLDKDKQFIEARTKSDQDAIMTGWSESEFLDMVRQVFGSNKKAIYEMYESQAIALLREAKRRGIKIAEKPVIDYEDGKQITRPMKTEDDLRAEDPAYDVERIEPKDSSSGKAAATNPFQKRLDAMNRRAAKALAREEKAKAKKTKAKKVKPPITSIFDDDAFIALADQILSPYLDTEGNPKGFIPTTPELDALYKSAESRGIDLVDIRKESYKSIGPDGKEVIGSTGDMPSEGKVVGMIDPEGRLDADRLRSVLDRIVEDNTDVPMPRVEGGGPRADITADMVKDAKPATLDSYEVMLNEELGTVPKGSPTAKLIQKELKIIEHERKRQVATGQNTTSPRPTASPAVAPLSSAPTEISPDLPAVSIPRTDLSKRTTGQLNKLDEKLLKELETLNPRSPEYAAKVQEMQEVTAELNRREALEVDETPAQVEEPLATEASRPHAGLPAEQLLDLRDNLEQQTIGHKTVPASLRDALELVNAEINGRKTGIFKGPDESMLPPETPQPRTVIETEGESLVEPPPLDPKKFRAAASRLTNEDIDAQIERLSFEIGQGTKTIEIPTKKGSRKATVGEDDIDKIKAFQNRLSVLMKERAKRSMPPPKGPDGAPPPTGTGLKLYSNPSVGAFLGGYTYGWLFADDDATLAEKNSRAFMWGAVAAGAVNGANYMRARRRALTLDRVSPMLPNRNQFPQAVYSIDDLQRPNRPFMARMRDFYRGVYRKTVQGTEGIETLTEKMGRKEESAERSAYKLASMFGTWISRNEAFNTSRLTYVENGEPHLITNQTFTDLGLDVDPETGPQPLPLSEILSMADGDKRALGDLAVAYASAEGAGRGPVPMDVAHREALIRGAHPKLRLAVKELRKYNLSLLITMHKGGRLSLEGLQAAGSEAWYTPLQRIVAAVDRLNMRTGTNKINAPNPLLGRKGGSSAAVLNPYEATVDLTRRMLRAVEYGQVSESLVSLIETLPKDQQVEILQPVMPSANPKVAALNQVMGSSDMKQFQAMTNMSDADIKSLLAYIDDETTNNAGQFSLFRNGELHTYRLTRPDIFESLKSLTPTEIDMFTRFMGAPTRVSARGTVLNPIFALNQLWMDNLSVALNSKYGMVPGWDTFFGWYHAMTNSPKYQRLIDVGGPGSITQLDYTNPETAMQASRLKGVDVVDTAIKSIKEWSPVRAYKAFLYPILDAPRIAEYLAALRNGATTLEAAYAAHEVGGNLRMQGSLQGVRLFHHLTLFSRPAVAAIAKGAKEIGLGMHAPEYSKTMVGRTMQKAGVPRRAAGAMSFMTRGFAYIAVPTMMLWWLNKNDEKIKQLRKTTGGQRYWFARIPGFGLVKGRKPHVIGQIFGTAVENWLDSAQEENPDALATWMETLMNDASINMLPQIGVVPYSLWANKSLGLNSPLVPRREEQLNPSLQGYDRASMPARIIAEKLEPLSTRIGGEGVLETALRRGMSPAGIDYIIGQISGMSGQDAVRLAGVGIEYARSGFPPPKEELPFIGRLYAAYPSMNIYEVQTFYNHDAEVMEVVRTLDWWEKRDPSKLPDYINENLRFLTMAKEHQETRQFIADMRRAIDDMRRMPEGTVSRQAQKKTEAHFVKLIEERLRITNDVWSNVMKAYEK